MWNVELVKWKTQFLDLTAGSTYLKGALVSVKIDLKKLSKIHPRGADMEKGEMKKTVKIGWSESAWKLFGNNENYSLSTDSGDSTDFK